MANSIDEKLKSLKNEISLNKLFSENEQLSLSKKSLSEQNEAIVKSIFDAAQTKGVPIETLKKFTNNYELKIDKNTNEAKTKRLSLIESMAKKVSKELQKKYTESSQNKEHKLPLTINFSFPKGFINQLLKEPNKMARINTIQTALEPQLLLQMPKELLHMPFSEATRCKNISLVGTGLNLKPGNGTVLETFSQMLAEVFEYSRLKASDKRKSKTVYLGANTSQNEKPNQPKKDDKPKDMINISTDHINDMVLPGETVDVNQKEGQDDLKAVHSGNVDDKNMTADEELKIMQEMGLVPPWLRKD